MKAQKINKLKKKMKHIEKKYAEAEGQSLYQERLMKQATVIERKIKEFE